MTIAVRLFASLRDRAGQSEWSANLPEGAGVRELLSELSRSFPSIADRLPLARIAVNDEYVTSDALLRSGDCVVLIPPVSGGRHV